MRGAVTWYPAPAKLNLMLRVVGRRADGYHDLQTVFQLVDLCDEVGIEVTGDGIVERVSGAQGVPADEDLIVRAARALQALAIRAPQLSGTVDRPGARLHLHKRIPMGGGLGGGSSDAATTLLVLNRLWGLRLPVEKIAEIGLQIGSDVPVFVAGSNAWAEGRGERLTPIELPERWFLVIHPGVHVATAAVFQAPELTRNSPLITIRAFLQGQAINDCESAVRARYPEVAAALDWLGGHSAARLTGTGACVFASFASAAEAERIAGRVPDRWRAWVVRGLQRSPLCAALGGMG